jgi:hypothetical protein
MPVLMEVEGAPFCSPWRDWIGFLIGSAHVEINASEIATADHKHRQLRATMGTSLRPLS